MVVRYRFSFILNRDGIEMNIKTNRKFPIYIAVLCVVGSGPAHAYIDPASGGAIISTIIGAFVAFGLLIKGYWYRIKRLVFGNNKDSTK